MALGQLCVFPAAHAPIDRCFELILSIPLRIPPSMRAAGNDVPEPQPNEQTGWEVMEDVFVALWCPRSKVPGVNMQREGGSDASDSLGVCREKQLKFLCCFCHVFSL